MAFKARPKTADTPWMLGKSRWISLLLAAVLATVGMGLTASADTATEGEFLSLINAERASNGLGPLTVDGGLQAQARVHTEFMIDGKCADDQAICHSTSEELAAAAGSGWSKIGENVGRGGTPASLHAAFMNSPGHAANILGDYNYVGIGTDTSGSYLYVTVIFMKKGSTSPPATSPPTTTDTPTTTKAPTTTVTTVPSTTTTSLVVGPDKVVTPGTSCVEATRFWQLCRD